eukprot:TRINITY_DN55631_c0_g1_i1.p1 TRINITY_DN55631_c0_g1~~TRINITY_DN55631_c0_g1_i1.p1  ORF type:complete len:628 (+),score=149.18 TRINITY_DN55631_c0_g1_i1:63-1886(+)
MSDPNVPEAPPPAEESGEAAADGNDEAAPAAAAAAPAAAEPVPPGKSGMWKDVDIRLREYPSTWRKTGETEIAEMEVQTEEIPTGEEYAQTLLSIFSTSKTEDQATETDPMAPSVEKPIVDGESYLWASSVKAGDEDDVLGFLEEKAPLIEEMLEFNAHSHAYQNYNPNWMDVKRTMDCVLDLTAPKPTSERLQVTGCSWNCTGGVIAASYGRIDTVGWCTNKGYVCCWNVNSRKLRQEVPDLCIEADNFVMCLAFHPKETTLLAGGTYNGEVVVWDISNADEPQVAVSRSGPASHCDPIKQVRWVRNTADGASRVNLMSCSADGRILLWSMQNQLGQPLSLYEPLDRKNHTLGVTAVSVLYSGFGSYASVAAELDVSSLECSVIAGTEPGSVVRCAVKPVEKVPDLVKNERGEVEFGKDIKLVASNPVVMSYAPHTGPVQVVDANRFHRHLFLSASSDGNVNVYNALDSEPVLVMSPSPSLDAYVYAAAWSPFRPLVFAVGCRDSYLYVYDLEHSRVKAAVTQKVSSDSAAVLTVQFNEADPRMMASGDAAGHLKVWDVADTLFRQTQHEKAMLAAKDPQEQSSLWFRVGGIMFAETVEEAAEEAA